MARSVDQIQNVLIPIFCSVIKANGLRLDGNSPFTFEIHRIE